MSRKHFIALAAEFRAQVELLKGDTLPVTIALNATRQAIECVCRVAADANPNFDRARFLKACGIA